MFFALKNKKYTTDDRFLDGFDLAFNGRAA